MADQQLLSYVGRIEKLESDKRDLATDIGDIYKEVKSAGFDPKIVRALIRERRMDAAEREERDALLETYRAALGDYASCPLGAAAMENL